MGLLEVYVYYISSILILSYMQQHAYLLYEKHSDSDTE